MCWPKRDALWQVLRSNNGQLKTEHFRTERRAVLLTDEGRRLALDLLEKRRLGAVK